jgi:hypothetical protein
MKRFRDVHYGFRMLLKNPGFASMRFPGGSSWKSSVEFFVVANPCPHPLITSAESHRPIIKCYANRPKARILSEALKMKAWMRRILRELLICLTRCTSSLWRQSAVEHPEFGCPSGTHEFRSNSASVISGKASGFRCNSASISSPRVDKAGRGVGSLIILSHCLSPSAPGRTSGSRDISSSRSSKESALIAAVISSTVFTSKQYALEDLQTSKSKMPNP